jgi:citrate lyase subunit beta/citryl-CoA lyase
VESGEAFFALETVARAPQVVRLALGHLDLMADLSMEADDEQSALSPARWALVLASRRAGLAAPIDGVTTGIGDGQTLVADTRRALRCGFGAKLCIHPAQVDLVHATMAPSGEQLAWAARVLSAASGAGSGGAVMVDGNMVDAPVLRLARQLQARALPGRCAASAEGAATAGPAPAHRTVRG